MTTLDTPPTIQATTTPNVIEPSSPHVGRIPLAASQIPQPLPSNPPPHKSRSLGKFVTLLLLIFVLAGGIGVAYYLNTNTQDIRQQATLPEDFQPQPFTFQYTNPETEEFTRSSGNLGPASIRATIDFLPTAPNCGVTRSCNAQVRATLVNEAGAPAVPESCTINTASLVFYRFLTNANDANYPDNLASGITVNGQQIPANCNRPVSECGSDPNCYQPPTPIVMYGPPSNQCDGQCSYFESSVDFNITDLEYGCGCVQFDPNVSEITLNCNDPANPNEPALIKYTRSSNNGPWAYGYNNAQCDQPLPSFTPTPPPVSPTPTLPTATPTPVVGPMCVSISMSPTNPSLGNQVTFTCGRVNGITEYQFRYFEPGSSTPISLTAANLNVSSPLTVSRSGTYRAQCRICPSNADSAQTCANLNWGWDPIPNP